jgi:predicted Zn-dependent protease
MCLAIFWTLPASAQLPCDKGLTGEGQIAQHAGTISELWSRLMTAYQQGDKKQEEDLVKRLEGYANHRDITFSDDERNKMEELAQRPEVKTIIEAIYAERRAEETERAHRFNLAGGCFFYPNPLLQDKVNQLGQRLVPATSTQFYAFRIVNYPLPDAWAFSTGSVYITTGLVSMLDNEAQLAYVLAHEIGHVEHLHMYKQTRGEVLQQLLEVEKMKSARKKGLILGAVAAGIGGALGAKEGGAGALLGAGLGFTATTLVVNLVESLRRPKFTDWSNVEEADADEFAAHEALQNNFDVREAPKIFVALEGTIHHDDRVGRGFHYGLPNSLAERRQHVQTLLTGVLKADLEQRAKAGLQTASPNFALLMSQVKRDNGELALEYDLFDEARQNLESAISLRSDDPKAHLYLGLAYKLTARTSADEEKAMDHFMQAIRLDAGRSAYARPHLEHALTLLKKNDPAVLPEAQREIKNYIELYKVDYGGGVPPNMSILYDYLSLTGDDQWSQRQVLNVAQASAAAGPSTEVSKPEVKKAEVKKPK